MILDGTLVKELQKRMRQIPFGNSAFQCMTFVGDTESPERKYRSCLLQIHQKLNALVECGLHRRRLDIDLREITEKLKVATEFEHERLLVDKDEKEFQLERELKLIEDAVIEINVYLDILKQLPAFTREQFESAERTYWTNRLMEDAKRECLSTGSIGIGTLHSLNELGLIVSLDSQHRLVVGTQEEQKSLITEMKKELT